MNIRNTLEWERACSDGSRDARQGLPGKPPGGGGEKDHGYWTGYNRTRRAQWLRNGAVGRWADPGGAQSDATASAH